MEDENVDNEVELEAQQLYKVEITTEEQKENSDEETTEEITVNIVITLNNLTVDEAKESTKIIETAMRGEEKILSLAFDEKTLMDINENEINRGYSSIVLKVKDISYAEIYGEDE